ncbi:PAS domain S-box-containing protein [Pontibacter ummariensis]|uniref:histidine kinase n=1 Tax=Pontibacter ummariensis TaxID=1610492 RepID=A0A239DES6_9BACT|nr:PAS domain-containing sensor histidine kinase [Pontibacter ummariensis]PRY14392.1 PAS domain S-box-containing protein [Pontibacter ummariensis]SNS30905.1 PAS domain S-box-containing protein [Pontibacter ummariensis]
MNAPQPGWESFVNRFPDPIARYDKQYKHLFINEAIENEIGMRSCDVIGKSNRDLRIPNDDGLLNELEAKIRSVFETGKPEVNYTEHQFPNGTRYYYMKLIPDFHEGEGNGVRSVWAITRDVTHLKQTELGLKEAEASLRTQNAELSQLNADLDTFFDTVSHDLYGPLNNVKGLVEVLKDAGQEEIASVTQMLESSVQRFDEVLTGLTEIVELKNKHGQAKEVELDDVFRVVQAELKKVIDQTGTTFSTNFSEYPTVHFPRPYLESLFRNMISNSIKYRFESRAPHIHIESGLSEGCVVLQFEDNGMGINLEQNGNRIFKPFQQLESKREGKGMGLSIVKNILERSGGRVEVKSEVGAGTTFTCYLNLTL